MRTPDENEEVATAVDSSTEQNENLEAKEVDTTIDAAVKEEDAEEGSEPAAGEGKASTDFEE